MKALVALALVMLFACPTPAQPPQKQNEVFLGFGDRGVIFMLEDAATSIGLAPVGGRVTCGDPLGELLEMGFGTNGFVKAGLSQRS